MASTLCALIGVWMTSKAPVEKWCSAVAVEYQVAAGRQPEHASGAFVEEYWLDQGYCCITMTGESSLEYGSISIITTHKTRYWFGVLPACS